MEAIKMVISAMPAWIAVVCLVGGVFIGALALVRLGYSVVVAKAAYKWICWAEEMKGRGYLVLLFSDSIGYSRLYFCC